jgi:hypothetical protein
MVKYSGSAKNRPHSPKDVSMPYQHRQIGYLMIAALAAAGTFITLLEVLGPITGPKTTPGEHFVLSLGLLAVLAILAVLFSSLTISVDDDRLNWYFGPGFWKKNIPLDEVVAAQPVRNKWWYGWGIRLTPHGWLYNVSGFQAVEIILANGRKIRLGTDEPDALQTAIRGAKSML